MPIIKPLKKFGYSLEELLAKKIFELHPESELNHSGPSVGKV